MMENRNTHLGQLPLIAFLFPRDLVPSRLETLANLTHKLASTSPTLKVKFQFLFFCQHLLYFVNLFNFSGTFS